MAQLTADGEELLKQALLENYSWESQEEIQEDLLTKRLMSPSGKFPDSVIIEHFVGESE